MRTSLRRRCCSTKPTIFFCHEGRRWSFSVSEASQKDGLTFFLQYLETKRTNQATMQRNKRLIAVRCTVVMVQVLSAMDIVVSMRTKRLQPEVRSDNPAKEYYRMPVGWRAQASLPAELASRKEGWHLLNSYRPR